MKLKLFSFVISTRDRTGSGFKNFAKHKSAIKSSDKGESRHKSLFVRASPGPLKGFPDTSKHFPAQLAA
jgi:hypothetical protein